MQVKVLCRDMWSLKLLSLALDFSLSNHVNLSGKFNIW